MKANLSEIEVNGVKYVPKGSNINPEVQGNYVIVRTRSAGVHAGILKEEDGMNVILEDARRLYYWDGAATLSQLAMEGVSKPENCKFPCEVTRITLTEAIEIIPCTSKAINSIKEVAIWKH